MPSPLETDERKGLPAISPATSDKIKSIETFRVPPRWLFVKVETEKGIVGWGEATLEGHAEAVEGAFEDFKERFIGWEAANIEDIYQSAYRHRFYRGGEVLMSALAGLDIALWDIKGKALGVPVWQLLGGKVRDRVAVYGWIGGDRPNDVLRQAKDRKDQGFTAVKMNAVESLGWLACPDDLKATAERLKDVRSTGIDVGLDFHGRVHKTMAKQLARMLEPYQPLFIEEPLLPGHIEELTKLYQQTTTPIALGERLFTRQMVRPYLESGCIDIIQPDISHSGGISETKRIATMAETYDVGVAPHCPLGPISFAASLQIAISAPNFLICEMSWKMHYNLGSDYDLFSYLKDKNVFKVMNGFIEALSGPGLGIDIDEDLVREAAKETKEFSWRNPVWRGPDGGIREW
ncbi:enolase C-terminal domain-like protein [Lipomyces tetrasporus]|uniref:Enolase C-terminal domain-like protein n=1 Tax=Lipomyces tetrasporus TaxID=54092 RepID=A0AAD7QRG1_9ASCO|nr:enolase C-terminal domain-like protein [Lipomyces tetrasporus]KAJ8100174.1 enolase C-terminal domain-like protein [Lipomyces tetrasporus]